MTKFCVVVCKDILPQWILSTRASRFRRVAGATAILAVEMMLLAACGPVNARVNSRPAQLPTPTATPYVDLAAAPRPNFGVRFPADPLLIAPVATQPPTPLPELLLPAPTPTPEVLGDILTVGVASNVPDEWASHLLGLLNQTDRVTSANSSTRLQVLDQPELARTLVDLRPYAAATNPLVTRVLVAVARHRRATPLCDKSLARRSRRIAKRSWSRSWHARDCPHRISRRLRTPYLPPSQSPS